MKVLDIIQPLYEFKMPSGPRAGDLTILPSILRNSEPGSKIHQEVLGLMTTLMQRADQLQLADEQNSEPTEQPIQEPIQQNQQPLPSPDAPVADAVPIEQPQEEQTITEAVMTDEELAAEFEKRLEDPEDLSWMVEAAKSDPAYEKRIVSMKAKHLQTYRSGQEAGEVQTLTELTAFFANVKAGANKLAAKALGVLEPMREYYMLQAQRQALEDGTIPPDTLAEAQRPEITRKSLYPKILYPLENIFIDLGFGEGQTPPNMKAFRNYAPKIINFMEKCEEGIIEFEDLLKSKQGNIRTLVTRFGTNDDLEIYDKIYQKLLSADAGQGGGAWGPAEIGLSILCKPVKKAQGKGDLTTTVKGKEVGVEVKASRVATQGARIGGSGVLTGSGGRIPFTNALAKLCEKAVFPMSEVGVNYGEVTKTVTRGGIKTVVGTGEIKKKVRGSVNFTNMASPHWFTSFNEHVIPALKKKTRGEGARKAVVEFLEAAIGSAISSKGAAVYSENIRLISEIPEPDGTIDYETFKTQLTRMWYEIYKNTDGISMVLVINPLTGNFTIIKNGADLVNPKNKVVITGGIDFSDSQGKASPQIGIA
jgi:hypothetical protein